MKAKLPESVFLVLPLVHCSSEEKILSHGLDCLFHFLHIKKHHMDKLKTF